MWTKHQLSTAQSSNMLLKLVLAVILVGVAIADHYKSKHHHHAVGHHDDHHGYHGHQGHHGHHSHHGYHSDHHGHHGYHGDHHGHHGYHSDHHGHHGYHGDHHEQHGYHGDHHGHHGHGYHDHGHDYHHQNIDYKFKYDVKDDKTYNYQSRDEYKDGKNVYGSYSLVEPDGKVRVVKYKADDYGFHADVDYKGGYKRDYKPKQAYHKHAYTHDYKH